MGRITLPFKTRLKEELNNLEKSLRAALMNPERRDAFDGLKKAWSSEQGAMSYAKIPAVLDVMLLTATVDNRSV